MITNHRSFQTILGEADDPISRAIDIGGGQTCDVPGVLRQLDKTGFVILPKSLVQQAVVCLRNTGFAAEQHLADCLDEPDRWSSVPSAKP